MLHKKHYNIQLKTKKYCIFAAENKTIMITNREEVIDKAFRVFLKMNYEKASISTLAKACGLAKTGIVYYFRISLTCLLPWPTSSSYNCRTP